jgi:hypothetical protein
MIASNSRVSSSGSAQTASTTLSGVGRVALLCSVVQGLTMALASGTVIGDGVLRDRLPDDGVVLRVGRYLRTGDPLFRTLARRWSKVMLALYAVGVVTGTILSFEPEQLWPAFMASLGNVFGLRFTGVIPRKGRPGTARQAHEHRRAFRRTVKWRTGSEARISTLKRQYCSDRARLDGLDGARTWTGHESSARPAS